MTAHLEGPLLCQPLLCTSLKGQALCPPSTSPAPAPAAGWDLWEAPVKGLLHEWVALPPLPAVHRQLWRLQKEQGRAGV